MLGPYIVPVCGFLATAYLAVLVYRSRKFRIRAGEIKFYPGIGPVIVPIPISTKKKEGRTWSVGSQESVRKMKGQ